MGSTSSPTPGRTSASPASKSASSVSSAWLVRLVLSVISRRDLLLTLCPVLQPDIPVQAGREAEAEAIIAEYGKGGDGSAGAPRSPVKPLNAVTPAKSAAKKNEPAGEEAEPVKETPAQQSPTKKSPVVKSTPGSTKRKASDAAALVREKVARVGTRSSPRAPARK